MIWFSTMKENTKNIWKLKKKKKKKVDAKYFKGLGTISDELVPETFGKKVVEYYKDEETDKTMQ